MLQYFAASLRVPKKSPFEENGYHGFPRSKVAITPTQWFCTFFVWGFWGLSTPLGYKTPQSLWKTINLRGFLRFVCWQEAHHGSCVCRDRCKGPCKEHCNEAGGTRYRPEDCHFEKAPKIHKIRLLFFSQTAMKGPTCCREKTTFFVMRNFTIWRWHVYCVGWGLGTYVLSHAGEFPGIQSNKANLRNPVKNLVDFTILDFRMVPVNGKSNERFFPQWFGCNQNH